MLICIRVRATDISVAFVNVYVTHRLIAVNVRTEVYYSSRNVVVVGLSLSRTHTCSLAASDVFVF